MLNLESYKEQIIKVCQESGVEKLELFGSFARNEENNDSDIDFLVEFNEMNKVGLFDRYFFLMISLEKIFKKKVDLVEISSLKNHFLIESINSSRLTIYEA